MNPPLPPASASRRRTSGLAWLLLLVMVPIAGALGWRAWQAEVEARSAADAEEIQRLDALAQRVGTLRANQQAQGKRMQQSEATNRLLRDELLAMGQRAALLEDSVQRLADPTHDAARSLRLDEIELLLAQAQQRLLVAGDLEGARRTYALATRLAEALTTPGDIDLRHALTRERAMLDALGEDPRIRAMKRIDAFEAGFDAGPAGVFETGAEAAQGAGATWWRRLARRIVEVRPSDDRLAVDSGEQAAGQAALRLELTLARAAAERRDADGYAAALARGSAWLPRLRPGSPARDALARELEAIAALPLALALPELGTSLEQLRRLRGNDTVAAPDAT
ncbi:uroporphyrinogen-III C-methyltransferase [Luteimonas sp. MJ246]|uniref:uroporphyrinogen-III C-methyltransferase n=1 Tax=Luteimonas sp. MJ174 TaxID=3129237 RepID=UPI0031BBC574